jgi:hypothetical protein
MTAYPTISYRDTGHVIHLCRSANDRSGEQILRFENAEFSNVIALLGDQRLDWRFALEERE